MTLHDIQRVHAIDSLSFSMPWSERSYRFELVENQNSITLVAETSPEAVESAYASSVVGMIVVWAILDEAHIATLAVHPGFRGMGIARRLLAEGLQAAYQRGARMAFLEVRRSNVVAQNLYFKFGFEIVGERPRYYQDNNEDAFLMNLDAIDPELLEQFAR